MKKITISILLSIGLLALTAKSEYTSFDEGNNKVWAGYADAKITLKIITSVP